MAVFMQAQRKVDISLPTALFFSLHNKTQL